MRRLALVASIACSLAFVACDDDEPAKPRDSGTGDRAPDTTGGTDTGGGGDTAAGMCTGSFATLTRTQLIAATPPTAKCGSQTDLDLICTGDLATKVRNAGVTCLGQGMTSPTALSACVKAALARDTALSANCAGCYGDSAGCTIEKCAALCGTMPNSAECMACQATQGCISAFFACAGLPPPGTRVDGGADGGTDGGTPDTSGDTTPDVAAETGGDVTPADAGVDTTPDTSPDTAADVGSDV
jgi:hypothetical protein